MPTAVVTGAGRGICLAVARDLARRPNQSHGLLRSRQRSACLKDTEPLVTLRPYGVASPIEYLVDWVGILDYYRLPIVRENFEIIVDDLDENLAVMKRRNAR